MDSAIHHRENNQNDTSNNNKSIFCNCHRHKAGYWVSKCSSSTDHIRHILHMPDYSQTVKPNSYQNHQLINIHRNKCTISATIWIRSYIVIPQCTVTTEWTSTEQPRTENCGQKLRGDQWDWENGLPFTSTIVTLVVCLTAMCISTLTHLLVCHKNNFNYIISVLFLWRRPSTASCVTAVMVDIP